MINAKKELQDFILHEAKSKIICATITYGYFSHQKVTFDLKLNYKNYEETLFFHKLDFEYNR